jgi:hypothetical protein
MAAPSWSIPPPAGTVARSGVGDPVAERHVEHEQRTVREGKPEPDRLGGQPDVGEGEYAGHGERKRKCVARASDPSRSQNNNAEELDRTNRGQRQPRERQIEHRVHNRQHYAQRQ